MTLIDAHVHLYPCYDRVAFLDGASRNFARHGSREGVLLLAERSAEDAFAELAAAATVGDWSVARTAEPESLQLMRGDEHLVILAGRQIVTDDGLEVLSLCSTQRMPDRLPTEETLRRVADGEALAVLPWGVGKWTGQRGQLVARLLDSPISDRVFVGDNAGRLRWSRTPRELVRAVDRQRWVLPGTDPLPLPSEQRRAGSYGLVIEQPMSLQERPAAAVRAALRDLRAQPRTYGELTGPLRFLRNQAQMQLRKRQGKAARGLGRS